MVDWVKGLTFAEWVLLILWMVAVLNWSYRVLIWCLLIYRIVCTPFTDEVKSMSVEDRVLVNQTLRFGQYQLLGWTLALSWLTINVW